MSDSSAAQDPTAKMFGEAQGMFNKMWSEFANKMASGGFAMPQEQTPAEAAKQMRDTFFASWAEACERYMRSEEFQQVMRDSMKAAIELRKQMNEQMGGLQHTLQGASRQDIDRLFKSISDLEARFTETYEPMVTCLEAVSERLNALENQTHPPEKPKAKATTKKRGKKKSR